MYEKSSRSSHHYCYPCYFLWMHPVINTPPTNGNHHYTPTNYADANGFCDTDSAIDTFGI